MTSHEKTPNIAYQSIVVFTITLVGQLLGFFREVTFGKYFGTTRYFDAFTLVFSIILFANNLLTIIPFFAIPALAGIYSRKDWVEFSKQLSQIVILILFLVAVFILIGEVFAGRIVGLFGTGLSEHSNIFSFSIFLMRISIPIFFLLAVSQILRSVLNLQNSFAIPALEPLIFNIGIIMAVTLSWNFFNVKSPISIVFGWYFAYIVFVSLCFSLSARFENSGFWGRVDFKTMKGLSSSLLFLLVATCLNSLNPLVLIWYASHLSEGAVSAFGYVQRLLSFSIINIVRSVLVVFLPTASIYLQREEHVHLREETEKIMNCFVAISIFVSGFIFLNNETLVRLIYNRGMFDEYSVKLVSGLLYYYLPWFVFYPLGNISMRILYAAKDYKPLAIISAAGLIFTLSVVPTIQKHLGLNGLGLMSSLHMAFYSILLTCYINIRHFRLTILSILKNGTLNFFWAGLIVLALSFLKKLGVINNYAFMILSLLFLFSAFLWRINRCALKGA